MSSHHGNLVEHCWELNLYSKLESSSLEEVASYDVWKEAIQNENDAFIKNGTWKLVNPPF